MRTHVTDTPSGAESVQQLAVLLEAGIAPVRAWQLLAEAGDPVAADVASAPPGTRISEVLDAHGETWRQIAIVWSVAETVGAPLASSLRRFAGALTDAQETRDDVGVALAEPTATARLVGWMPLVAIALGLVLGFDILSTLTQPVEGAIFAEIIPFSETRDYVKKVLSNAVFYAALFSGQPQSLKQRLGRIMPQSAGKTELP